MVTGLFGTRPRGESLFVPVSIAKGGTASATAAAARINLGLFGRETLFVPASQMTPATTSPPLASQIESTTNKINYEVLGFDATADEFAHFHIALPKRWDGGTITYRVHWTVNASVTTGVAWALQAASRQDTLAIDVAYGTAIVVQDDSVAITLPHLISPTSAALTIGGSIGDAALQFFRLFRDVSDANDDMTQDALLLGVEIFWTAEEVKDD